MAKFKLDIKKDEVDVETIFVELSSDEVESLEEYIKNTENLVSLAVVKNGLKTSVNIKASINSVPSVSSEMPSYDDVCALLHVLRRFILTREFASYDKVSGIIKRRVKSSNIRSLVERERAVYSGKELQKLYTMSFNSELVNSEQTLSKWLNGYEYHNDREKKQFISNMLGSLSEDNAKAVFLSLLTEKVKAIVAISKICCLLLGRITRLESNV